VDLTSFRSLEARPKQEMILILEAWDVKGKAGGSPSGSWQWGIRDFQRKRSLEGGAKRVRATLKRSKSLEVVLDIAKSKGRAKDLQTGGIKEKTDGLPELRGAIKRKKKKGVSSYCRIGLLKKARFEKWEKETTCLNPPRMSYRSRELKPVIAKFLCTADAWNWTLVGFQQPETSLIQIMEGVARGIKMGVVDVLFLKGEDVVIAVRLT